VDIVFPPGYDAWTRDERLAYFRTDSIAFIAGHPLDYVGLMFRKLLWLWLPVYPEYSLVHKLWSGALYSSVYVLAIVGAWHRRRSPLTKLLVGVIAAVCVEVMLTIMDFDGRYRLPVLVALMPLTAVGIADAWSGFRSLIGLRPQPSPALTD
jgi:hypothetical protein